MTYDDITLSTLAGLSAWEKEINRLAGKTEIWSLRSESIEEPYKLRFSDIVDWVEAKTIDGNIINPELTDGTDMKIPIEMIVEMTVGYSRGGVERCKFSLTEARSKVLHSDADLTATLSSERAWFLATVNYTWQDKIDLAKKILRQDIITDIMTRYPTIESDTEAISLITNPEIFSLASDMKVLELIYADLANSGYNQLYEAKANNYAQRYAHEKDKAMSALRLSGYEGDTVGSRAFFGGNIVK